MGLNRKKTTSHIDSNSNTVGRGYRPTLGLGAFMKKISDINTYGIEMMS